MVRLTVHGHVPQKLGARGAAMTEEEDSPFRSGDSCRGWEVVCANWILALVTFFGGQVGLELELQL